MTYPSLTEIRNAEWYVAAERDMGATHFATTRDGVRIAHTADGNGPPLVFARGWITHLEYNWTDPALRAFFDRLLPHFRVIRYDGRGNGLSDRRLPGPVDLDALVADLEAVFDATGVERGVLWGSSWAGPAAAAYAARHPERVTHLVLDGTFAWGEELAPPDRRDDFLAMLRMARHQPDAVFAALSFSTDPEPGGSHARRVERMRRTIEPDTLIELYSLLYRLDVRAELPAIAAPTLVLHRRGSRAVPFSCGRSLAAMVPGARFVGLEGRAHNPWEEGPADVLAALGEFLGVEVLAEPAVDTVDTAASAPVAVMFTDIVDSTALTRALGDHRAQDLVRTHNLVVREALARFGGTEVKHTGDGLMVSFRSVSRAVAAAVAMQVALAERREAVGGGAGGDGAGDTAAAMPEVRIGINAGEPLSEDDDLYGIVVNVAARACDAGGAGQIVTTAVVRDLAAGKGFDFRDLGERSLKGIDEPVRLWEVAWR